MSAATKTYDKILHFAIFDVAVKAGVAAAIAEAPFLGWPVVKQIFEFLVNKMGNFIFEQLSRAGVFAIVDFQTEQELKKYNEAKDDLKRVIEPPEGTVLSEEEEQKAIAEFKKRLAELVRLQPA